MLASKEVLDLVLQLEAKIKELQAENVKLRLIVFGYYDQFKNDMGICGLNTEAKEILKGGNK
ncbi:MAG: hypothetical protein WC356_02040 [Candidatus Micrarchaeia archaeon]|jgi:hypothetical protein